MRSLSATTLLFGLFVSHGFEAGLAYSKGRSRGSGFGEISGIGRRNAGHLRFEYGSSSRSVYSSTLGGRSGSGLNGGLSGSSGSGHGRLFGGSGTSGIGGGSGSSSESWFSGAFGRSGGPARSSGFGSHNTGGLGRSYPRRDWSSIYYGTFTPWVYGVGRSVWVTHGKRQWLEGSGMFSQSGQSGFGSMLSYGTESSRSGRSFRRHGGKRSRYGIESRPWRSFGREGIQNDRYSSFLGSRFGDRSSVFARGTSEIPSRGAFASRSSRRAYGGLFVGSGGFGGHLGSGLASGGIRSTDSSLPFGEQTGFSGQVQGIVLPFELLDRSGYSSSGSFRGHGSFVRFSNPASFGLRLVNSLRPLQSKRPRRHYRMYLRREPQRGMFHLLIRVVSRRSRSYHDNL